eukprot:1145143-Pelagomonas_calceolata.AAC.7
MEQTVGAHGSLSSASLFKEGMEKLLEYLDGKTELQLDTSGALLSHPVPPSAVPDEGEPAQKKARLQGEPAHREVSLQVCSGLDCQQRITFKGEGQQVRGTGERDSRWRGSMWHGQELQRVALSATEVWSGGVAAFSMVRSCSVWHCQPWKCGQVA